MGQAVLIYGKPDSEGRLPWTPVKTIYNNPIRDRYSYELLDMKFDAKGVLISFNIKIGNHIPNFTYEFEPELSGYYRQDSFLDYKQEKLTERDIKYDILPSLGHKHKFPVVEETEIEFMGFRLADTDDTITVERLNPISPYTGYYKESKYEFLAELDTENELITYTNLNQFPANATITPNDVDLLNSPTGHFYTKNFGQYVGNFGADITDEQKEEMSVQMTLLCWDIYWIIEEGILDKLAMEPIYYIKQATWDKYTPHNPSSTDYDGLQRIDQLIGELLRDWGYLTDTDEFSSPVEAIPMLSSTPNVDEMLSYRNNLISLYNSLIYEEEDYLFPYENGFPVRRVNAGDEDTDNLLTFEQDSERRVSKLFASLYRDMSVFSVEDKINLLNDFIDKKYIEQESKVNYDERDVLILLASMAPTDLTVAPNLDAYTDANKLLGFLLQKRDGTRTNFEILYYKMDDKFADNIAFIQWFVSESNNRQKFVNVLHRIWYISQYNFEMAPSFVNKTHDDFNQDSFFLNDGSHYLTQYNQAGDPIGGSDGTFIIEITNESGFFSDQIKYKPTLHETQREKVIITKETTETDYIPPATSGVGTGPGVGSYQTTTVDEPYGEYHLYQPITLIGYNPNGELQIPNQGPLPAFVFFYAEEYNKFKNLAGLISLGLELALEVGLFFGTGGISQIRHLRHIKYVTKLRHAKKTPTGIQWLNGFTPNEKILFWQGIAGAGELTSAFFSTASVFSSFAQYQVNTQGIQNLEPLNGYLTTFFTVMSIFSSRGISGFSPRMSREVLESGEDVIKEIDRLTNLNPPVAHGVPQEVLDAINSIKGLEAVAQSAFFNRIATLTTTELGTTNHIQGIVNTFNNTQKAEFFADFGDKLKKIGNPNTVDDIDFWKQMNKSEDVEEINYDGTGKVIFDSTGNITTSPVTHDAARIKFWKDFDTFPLKKERAKMTLLDAYTTIRGNSYLTIHTHYGHRTIQPGPSGSGSKPKLSGFHNSQNLKNPSVTLGPGEVRWRGTPVYYKNDVNSYQQGRLETYFNLTDPRTGNPFIGGGGTPIVKKKQKNVTCPISWDTKRINQEMAYMYSKINFKKPDGPPVLNSDGEYSFFFTVKASDNYSWKAVFKGSGSTFNLNKHSLNTMYPDYF